MPDIKYDPDAPTFRFKATGKANISGDIQLDWISQDPRMTNGIITWASPVYRKFIGAHWRRLQVWLDSKGNCEYYELPKPEIQLELDFTKEASNVVV